MRLPRASAVIVALSTLVAVVTVSTVLSQLGPFDRAGALLPDGPIVVPGDPVETATPVDADPASTTPADAPGNGPAQGTSSQPDVVEPAPAETVDEPDPDPEPSTPAGTSPGNSGNAPGKTDAPGNSGNAPGNNKSGSAGQTSR
jgi:hypothetical protein